MSYENEKKINTGQNQKFCWKMREEIVEASFSREL